MKTLRISLLVLLVMIGTVYLGAAQNILTSPIVKTATKYRITYVGVSLLGKVATVDVEFLDADGAIIEKKSLIFQGPDYPQSAATNLENAVKKALTSKGVVN